jgi:pimeloyl-ACP methyl ester carboxylesterase
VREEALRAGEQHELPHTGACRQERAAHDLLSCGAAQPTLNVFLHGWPELSISWREQLRVFAGLGFRALAPDMRGYGRSSVYSRHEDYALEAIVADMLELLGSLGASKAIWVRHDWGSPVVWSIA